VTIAKWSSAPRLSDEANQQYDRLRRARALRRGTGVSTTLNAVRERSAVKVARSVLRGPYAREGMGLPS
jgi:hypothetical protein